MQVGSAVGRDSAVAARVLFIMHNVNVSANIMLKALLSISA